MKQVIELKRKTYEELQQTVIELITEKCLLEKEIKHLKDRKDYYKHEYYSVCDLLEKMEKALDKTCFELMYYQERLFTLQKTITELGRCYYIGKDIELRNANEWKEWCMKDE